jgi:hypothetical protein
MPAPPDDTYSTSYFDQFVATKLKEWFPSKWGLRDYVLHFFDVTGGVETGQFLTDTRSALDKLTGARSIRAFIAGNSEEALQAFCDPLGIDGEPVTSTSGKEMGVSRGWIRRGDPLGDVKGFLLELGTDPAVAVSFLEFARLIKAGRLASNMAKLERIEIAELQIAETLGAPRRAMISAPIEAKTEVGVSLQTVRVDSTTELARELAPNGPRPSLTEVPSIKGGAFSTWFNELTPEELNLVWSSPALREAVEARLRAPGGMHEWHMVSKAPKFKEWGVTAQQIAEMRTPTSQMRLKNPPGRHGGPGSTAAHNEILDIIETSPDYSTFKTRLQQWANNRLEGGAAALPQGLRP